MRMRAMPLRARGRAPGCSSLSRSHSLSLLIPREHTRQDDTDETDNTVRAAWRCRTMAVRTLRLFLATLLMITACDAVKPFYRHFDEYLTSLGGKRPEAEVDGAGSNSKHRNVVTRGTSASANRRNMSCCMLGEMAGDKGFHCFADYYAARIVMRNRNRAHNRKMGFYGRYRAPNYGHNVMKTFEHCVQGQGRVFHKCCHLAALERRRDGRFRARASRASASHNATSDEEFGDGLALI